MGTTRRSGSTIHAPQRWTADSRPLGLSALQGGGDAAVISCREIQGVMGPSHLPVGRAGVARVGICICAAP